MRIPAQLYTPYTTHDGGDFYFVSSRQVYIMRATDSGQSAGAHGVTDYNNPSGQLTRGWRSPRRNVRRLRRRRRSGVSANERRPGEYTACPSVRPTRRAPAPRARRVSARPGFTRLCGDFPMRTRYITKRGRLYIIIIILVRRKHANRYYCSVGGIYTKSVLRHYRFYKTLRYAHLSRPCRRLHFWLLKIYQNFYNRDPYRRLSSRP